jgi:hypothetical protein
MARLARYANVSPGEFGSMTPARSRALDAAVRALLDDEWKGYAEVAIGHARLVAMALLPRRG